MTQTAEPEGDVVDSRFLQRLNELERTVADLNQPTVEADQVTEVVAFFVSIIQIAKTHEDYSMSTEDILFTVFSRFDNVMSNETSSTTCLWPSSLHLHSTQCMGSYMATQGWDCVRNRHHHHTKIHVFWVISWPPSH